MRNILFGFYDEKIISSILDYFQNQEINMDIAFSKLGIARKIKTKQYDTVIVREQMLSSNYTAYELCSLVDDGYIDTLIPILTREFQTPNNIKILLDNQIYNAIFADSNTKSEQIAIEICKIINQERHRMIASNLYKSYIN